MRPILYNGPTSPFGRMARVASLELEVDVDEQLIDVYTAEFLDAQNPLRQIPTLILGNGEVLFDSRVICRYLDSVATSRKLFGHEMQWDVETRWSLAIGVMEAGLQRRMEILRAEGEKSVAVINKLETRIDRAIDHMESHSAWLRDPAFRIDALATAVALEYTDFRYGDHWHQRCPTVSSWLSVVRERPSMMSTRPRS